MLINLLIKYTHVSLEYLHITKHVCKVNLNDSY